MPGRSLYEDRADRCRLVGTPLPLPPPGLQLSPQNLGTTRSLRSGSFPFVSPSSLAHWFANLTGPNSNPHKALLSKPLQQLGFSKDSLRLGHMPIPGPVSPATALGTILLCTHPLITAVTLAPGAMLGMYHVR